MDPATAALAFIGYSVLVYCVKAALYPRNAEPPPPFPLGWVQGHEYALLLSPDFWWAFRFKNRISQFTPNECKESCLKHYVQINNRVNVCLSVTLCVLVFLLASFSATSWTFSLILLVAIVRFVSRSFEITYAFGRDVLQDSVTTTRLTKYERIKLALISYIEIFSYSAAAYLILPTVAGPADAITLSLNVGTLTNVGYAFSKPDTPLIVNIVFIQVFTTLSLVVLSLASYLSREK